MSFDFRFDDRWKPILAGFGIRPSNSSVTITDEELDARFGPFRLRTPLDNVTGVETGGDYQWYRAIGARLSLADRGVTFGTNTESGVCVLFDSPVRALDPTGTLLHPGATFTVADTGGLADAVRRGGRAASG